MSQMIAGKPVKVTWGNEEFQVKDCTISVDHYGRTSIEINAVQVKPISHIEMSIDFETRGIDEWGWPFREPKEMILPDPPTPYEEAMKKCDYQDALRYAFPEKKRKKKNG